MNISEVSQWVCVRPPAALLSGSPEVALYDDEVVIVLPIVGAPGGAAAGPNEQRQAEYRLIAERRETRQLRAGARMPAEAARSADKYARGRQRGAVHHQARHR
ncbi:MAG: hypothetical protein U0Z44_05350 [Kouleothrix sp.]